MKGYCYKILHYTFFNRKDEQIKSSHTAMTFLFRQTVENLEIFILSSLGKVKHSKTYFLLYHFQEHLTNCNLFVVFSFLFLEV